MLLIAVGDGGDGSLTGWEYRATNHWKGKIGARYRRVSWWFPTPPPPDVKRKVNALRHHTKSVSGKRRLYLVKEALSINHPFVLPWLDDLLYEPGVRMEAAKACLTIGGDGVLLALIDSLGSPADPEGDRQIGELLNAFTGQQLGSDHASWDTWLKTGKKSK